MRPGRPEIVVSLRALTAAAAVVVLFGRLGLAPVVYGLIVAARSGIAGLVGFAAAALVCIRPLSSFSVRRTTWRWILIGGAAGVVAFVLKGVVNHAVIALTMFDTDPQGMYYDAAGGGVPPLILAILFLAVLTPVGKEGVVPSPLCRKIHPARAKSAPRMRG
ncbi:hypothetical protein [Nonomuraea aridisoli]|uniref:Uncharacterized protein n=1 Tax=Nonomuraea aridisoli TaxID=2070368 RepID=A0A2W2EGR8_9ACTN|nr:hypothetical protein [Nonomuraea aridisoli]PZG23522.1 hypothetical protein C1J01_00970 [Nonomuraea aridisoli]